MVAPYRSTPVFDADTLPAALRREHSTKAGVWGLIQLLEGSVELHFADGSAAKRLGPGVPGLVAPEQPHWVIPLGDFRMRIDFYDTPPDPRFQR